MTAEKFETTDLNAVAVRAEIYRVICADASRLGVRTVHGWIGRQIPSAEGIVAEDPVVYASTHKGSRPRQVDALATQAVRAHVDQELRQLPVSPDKPEHVSRLICAGEEDGQPTIAPVRGQLISRRDSLDGTSLARLLGDAFASVVLMDEVRVFTENKRSGRHLAGAITTATGWTVSWGQWSVYDADKGAYRRLSGNVFIEAEPWGIPLTEVPALRWNREHGTAAGVASSRKRREHIADIIDGSRTFYTVGGTPAVVALLIGGLERLVEPEHVTLHDSSLLIPFQLLGGTITNRETGEPLDYLRLYEDAALDFDLESTPIPPYIATIE